MYRTKEEEQMWAQFHKLWSRDVGREGYNKEEWKRLEGLIAAVLHQTRTSGAKSAED